METIEIDMALENENLQGLVLFAHINRLGSLSAAAQLLGLSRSSVSKQLATLEQKVGARLLNRTTRSISLTDVGREVLQQAQKVELALQTIEYISEGHQSEIAGALNISCSSAQGREHLMPLVTRFLTRYPKVSINVQLEDRFVDMVAENIDISIRIGYLPDSSLIARKLGDLVWVLCATPEYMKNAPPLNTPDDLINHRCLFYKSATMAMDNWTFSNKKEEQTITVSGPLSINDPGALVNAALDHAGVLLIDKGLLGDTMHRGALIPLLPDYTAMGGLPMYIVFPEKEFMPAKTRALIDFLMAEMPKVIQGKGN